MSFKVIASIIIAAMLGLVTNVVSGYIPSISKNKGWAISFFVALLALSIAVALIPEPVQNENNVFSSDISPDNNGTSVLDPKLLRTKINYFTEKSSSSPFSNLRATVDDQTYQLITESEELCLQVFDQRDYDGNGSLDALVEHVTACGGNCCGNQFFFYSYLGNGHFQKTSSFGYSWTDPIIEKWKGRWSVLVTSINEGVNTDALEERTERVILDAGKAVKVEESARQEILAIVELRSEQFDFNKTDEVQKISFDLDGDRIADEILGHLWHRWGRIVWSVNFSKGIQYESSVGCKRLGVLSSKTSGIHDLVCDHDDVLKWNGQSYQ